MHLGCCSTFGKRKNTLDCGSSIFTLSESLATPSCMADHAILHGKPFGIPLFLSSKLGRPAYLLARVTIQKRTKVKNLCCLYLFWMTLTVLSCAVDLVFTIRLLPFCLYAISKFIPRGPVRIIHH
jgi:hypothetical protein